MSTYRAERAGDKIEVAEEPGEWNPDYPVVSWLELSTLTIYQPDPTDPIGDTIWHEPPQVPTPLNQKTWRDRSSML